MTRTGFRRAGQGGEKLPKARALPEGTKVRLVEIGVSKSQYTQEIQKGPNAGKTIQKHQLKVVLEALEPGTTVRFKTGGKTAAVVEAHPFKAGDRFSQYLGGVYPADNGQFSITQTGGAGAFMDSLIDAGAPADVGALEDYAGATFTTKNEEGKSALGPYCHVLVDELLSPPTGSVPNSEEDDEEPDAAPTAPAAKGNPLVKAAAANKPSNAFNDLPADDRASIIEAVKAGTNVTPDLLTGAGLAKDKDHALAIIAAIPGA